MKLAVYSTHAFEKQYIEDANNRGFEIQFIDFLLTPETAILCQGAEAVAIFVNDDCSASTLERLKKQGVNYILLRSAGFNNVALDVAKELGIKVANVPSYSPYAVAEHTVALMLNLNRKLIKAHSRVTNLNFSLDGLVGFDMHGKTVGLIGLGKIGEKVARILNGFGCKILVVDPIKTNVSNLVTYVDIKELCEKSDIISLHAPLSDETKYIIDEEEIDLMKEGVMLINTSRGALLNTKSVIKGLKQKKIGYLGLDVYEAEKGLFFEDHSDDILLDDDIARLITFSNVLITSHQGFLTKTALTNISNTVFSNLENMINNDIFENQLV